MSLAIFGVLNVLGILTRRCRSTFSPNAHTYKILIVVSADSWNTDSNLGTLYEEGEQMLMRGCISFNRQPTLLLCFGPPLTLLHAGPSSREGNVSCLSPRKTTCTLPSYFPGSGAAWWWWWLISHTRCSFQICPLFINTRDCFRILGCLRPIHFAGEESLRERFK